MNQLATSKEDILTASRELIKENGWMVLIGYKAMKKETV